MPNVIVINAMATDMIRHVHPDTRVLSAEAMLKDIVKGGTSNQAAEAPRSKQIVVLMEVQKIRALAIQIRIQALAEMMDILDKMIIDKV
jgi:hypothetical protein